MPAYYPVFLDIRGRNCLVFGGNDEAHRKILYLIDCGASVTVFAQRITDALKTLARDEKFDWVQRGYQFGDLKNTSLAIVADTSDSGLNETISEEARQRNVLLNVMDVTPLCTFIAPAITHRSDVTVAVSTAGTSPALARRLRENMSDKNHCQCLRWADIGPILADVRTDIRARELAVTPDEWQECLTPDVLEMFESGDPEKARRMLTKALESKASSKSTI